MKLSSRFAVVKKLLSKKKETTSATSVSAEASAAPPAESKAAAAPPPVHFKGEQIEGTPCYFRSCWRFWWRIEGPSSGHVQNAVIKKWGQDGYDAMFGATCHYTERRAWMTLLKSDIALAPKRREAAQAEARREFDQKKESQRKAAAALEAKAAKKKVPAPVPEVATAASGD